MHKQEMKRKKKIGIVYYGLSEKVTRFVLAAVSGRKKLCAYKEMNRKSILVPQPAAK